MCRPTACRSCGKTTWAGCGQHVDAVMRDVPRDQRCTCTADEAAAASKRLSPSWLPWRR